MGFPGRSSLENARDFLSCSPPLLFFHSLDSFGSCNPSLLPLLLPSLSGLKNSPFDKRLRASSHREPAATDDASMVI